MNKKISLEDLKFEQKKILDRFVEYCSKHNIKYYLTYGTLLGAVRHKGYIPWDDDIDIMVSRSDYNFLINNNKITNNLEFISLEVDSDFPYTFGKIINTNTILIEEADFNYEKLGVNIDIFPIDELPNNKLRRETKIKWITFLKSLYNVKIIKNDKNRKVHKRIVLSLLKMLLFIINKKTILKKIIKSSNKQYANSNHCGIIVWDYGRKNILNCNDFDKDVLLDFENGKYNSISNFDKFLQQLYGDYMKLPPEDKRISNHEFKAYFK